jgi:uncharacterized protein with PIN domain
MKDLTDSLKRKEIISKAREKYSSVTKNITEALDLYLKNDSEEQIPLLITTPELHWLKEILKEKRPACNDCNGDMFMKRDARDRHGNINPTAWVCNGCGLIEYSDKTPKEWLEILRENRE